MLAYKVLSLTLFLLLICRLHGKLNPKSSTEEVSDHKEFKKILRTKNNVLVCFVTSDKESGEILRVFREAAEVVKGQGTMLVVDCSREGKKLCRKLKVSPEKFTLRHYKDGEFHKIYDRKETVPSLVGFMRDPAGETPWEEEETATAVLHLPDPNSLVRLIKKESRPILVMFYAPWCGFCKLLKPEYSGAASVLKESHVLAAIDVNRPENLSIRLKFNITGFPTLLYFLNGEMKYVYEGENKKEDIIRFMKDPSSVSVKPKVTEEDWSATDNDVVHLTSETFDSHLQGIQGNPHYQRFLSIGEERVDWTKEKTTKSNGGSCYRSNGELLDDSVLVMFYAPWCGHCKKMKPEYEKAATQMKIEKIKGSLAAVDATKEAGLGKRFGVKGYPTIKYFRGGQFAWDTPGLREATALLDFMKDPKEPPPVPPPEPAWDEQETSVVHLSVENFKNFLRKKKHALVMFYAPWCGHCKKAKPEFSEAAEETKHDPKVVFAAVDCTRQQSLCQAVGVEGYPTIKYFSYYNKEPALDYTGSRKKVDFLSFMKKMVKKASIPPKEEL